MVCFSLIVVDDRNSYQRSQYFVILQSTVQSKTTFRSVIFLHEYQRKIDDLIRYNTLIYTRHNIICNNVGICDLHVYNMDRKPIYQCI